MNKSNKIHTCHTLENYEKTKEGLDTKNPTFLQIKNYIETIIDLEVDDNRSENADGGVVAETMVKSTENESKTKYTGLKLDEIGSIEDGSDSGKGVFY